MVNKVILIGNVGADPEIHVFESGNKIARVRIATTERIFNPSTNIWNDHTEWHTIVANQRHSNFIEMYVKKGAQVYVEGRLRRREWGEGDDKRFFVEIRADEFRLLGRRAENDQYGATTSAPQGYSQQQASQPEHDINSKPASQPQSASQTATQYSTQPATPQQSYSPEADNDNMTDDLPF